MSWSNDPGASCLNAQMQKCFYDAVAISLDIDTAETLSAIFQRFFKLQAFALPVFRCDIGNAACVI